MITGVEFALQFTPLLFPLRPSPAKCSEICLFSLPLLLLQDPTHSLSCFETLILFPAQKNSRESDSPTACTFFGMQLF